MAYETITLEREDNVGIITLNRPPANPINSTLLSELNQALTEFKADKAIRALIITGAGDRFFSAGFDIKSAFGPDAARGGTAGPTGQEVFFNIEKFPKPVIAAINGYAGGGGCELAMSCHFRMMADAERAVIGQPEIDRGIIPGWGGTQRLPRLVGKTRALEMLLLGQDKMIRAPEALEIGLINKVSRPGEVMNDAKELAKKLAKKAPIAMSIILDCVMRGLETTIEQGIKIEAEGSSRVGQTKDAQEGMMAFVQKREPVYKGE
jgi:enoyl-CoA hydratase/carnithine racemase